MHLHHFFIPSMKRTKSKDKIKEIITTNTDSYTHKQPDKDNVKLLEVTKDNLNNVLLMLKEDKDLFKLNIKNILNFIFTNFEDKKEILAKLKVLKERKSEEEDPVDSIFRIVLEVLDYKVEEDLKEMVVLVSGEIYPFSRRLALWYCQNKTLEDDEVSFYLEEVERIIFRTAGVNFVVGDVEEEDVEEEDVSNNEQDSEENSTTSSDTTKDKAGDATLTNNATILDNLKVLTDSEEMDRLDRALGIVFKDRLAGLSVSDKQRIAKCLDVLETILENNSIDDPIHFKRLLALVDIDDVLFKKVFRVLKIIYKKTNKDYAHKLYADYKEALHKYRNIIRTVDTMQNYFEGLFRWMDVFKALSENDLMDLNVVDRSKVNKEEFYTYCFTEEVHLWKIQGLLLYFVKTENDVKILQSFRDLVNRIEFGEEKNRVIESINNRIRVVLNGA